MRMSLKDNCAVYDKLKRQHYTLTFVSIRYIQFKNNQQIIFEMECEDSRASGVLQTMDINCNRQSNRCKKICIGNYVIGQN